MPVLDLPLDALHRALAFAPPPTLLALSTVCRTLHDVVMADSLWRALCLQWKRGGHTRPYCRGSWRALCRTFGLTGRHGVLRPLVTSDEALGQWVMDADTSAVLADLREEVSVTCFIPLGNGAEEDAAMALALQLMGCTADCSLVLDHEEIRSLAAGLYMWTRWDTMALAVDSLTPVAHICLLAVGVRLPCGQLPLTQSLLHLALRVSSCTVVCMEAASHYTALECLDVLLTPLLSPVQLPTCNLVLALAGPAAAPPAAVAGMAPEALLAPLLAKTRLVEASTMAMWMVNYFGAVRAICTTPTHGCTCGDGHCQGTVARTVMEHLGPMLRPFRPTSLLELFLSVPVTGPVYHAIVACEVQHAATGSTLPPSVEHWAEHLASHLLQPSMQSSMAIYSNAMEFDLHHGTPANDHLRLRSFTTPAAPAATATATEVASSSSSSSSSSLSLQLSMETPVAVPLDVGELMRSHDHFLLTAMQRFACELDRLGAVHPRVTSPAGLKAELTERFRQLWRRNQEVSRQYCEETFEACFSPLEQRYTGPMASAPPVGGVCDVAVALEPGQTGPGGPHPLLWDAKALKRFYSCFLDIAEEYCMKAKGPRKYEVLVHKGTALLGRVQKAFQVPPEARLHHEDVAQACECLVQEVQRMAADGIQRQDDMRAEQQRTALLRGKHLALRMEVQRLQRLLDFHALNEEHALRAAEERMMKMERLSFADHSTPGGREGLAWHHTSLLTSELQAAQATMMEFERSCGLTAA